MTAERVKDWTGPVIGAVIAGALVFWVNDITMVQRNMIQKVADIGAGLTTHLDGHPGRVEEQVRELRGDVTEIKSEVRSMHRDIERLTKAFALEE